MVPVTVDGMPQSPSPQTTREGGADAPDRTPGVRVMVDIRMTDGLHVSRRGMTYPELLRFITNLEVLC